MKNPDKSLAKKLNVAREKKVKLHLFVDDGEESKLAMKLLEEANLEFRSHNIEGKCDSDWKFPTLFSPEGEFDTMYKIRTYVNSNFAKAYRRK